ncbi:hypothetical protein [Pantoea sp. 1.19]|uniref:hypothetical protein n=1 Tax=Pantoea sp. 1.19 TaxID=1925589 RepID=UPI0011150EE3|nr:hypothetical protein [Pantoea sp. 1.19]
MPRYLGMGAIVLAVAALLLFFTHVLLGPFTPPQAALQALVAGHVGALKSGLLSGLGLATPPPVVRVRWDADRVLDILTLLLAGLALVTAAAAHCAGAARGLVRMALALGCATFVLYVALAAAGIWLMALLAGAVIVTLGCLSG